MSSAKGYSISIILDSKTENMVKGFWKSLHDMGLSDYYYLSRSRPQVPLLVLEETDEELCLAALQNFAHNVDSFCINLELTGMFTTSPSSVFWLPSPTRELLELHHALYKAVIPFSKIESSGYYNPDLWMPHLGLASYIKDLQYLPAIVKSTMVFPSAFKAMAKALMFSKFLPIEAIGFFPLKKYIK
ncbi:MAG: hypothetical protein VB108_06475 [Anaerolineaceae bacterium]|nr:hypothetical protein [Anaerolineaceae bacterium]